MRAQLAPSLLGLIFLKTKTETIILFTFQLSDLETNFTLNDDSEAVKAYFIKSKNIIYSTFFQVGRDRVKKSVAK